MTTYPKINPRIKHSKEDDRKLERSRKMERGDSRKGRRMEWERNRPSSEWDS